jgi:hypothetical protein
MILHMLRNPVYIRKVRWKGIYDGDHEPIIPEKLFNKVQEILEESSEEWDIWLLGRNPLRNHRIVPHGRAEGISRSFRRRVGSRTPKCLPESLQQHDVAVGLSA